MGDRRRGHEGTSAGGGDRRRRGRLQRALPPDQARLADVVLLERDELTSGSTWHAAGGMHTINSDPNVAKLQDYTIRLYREIEAISGQSCGIHLTGGIMLAGTPERLDFLKTTHARGRLLGLESEFISLDEARRRHPLIETRHFQGALFDPNEGHIDPSGVTHAYAKSAQQGRRRDPPLHAGDRAACAEADGGWRVVTPNGSDRGRDRGQRRRALGARGRPPGRAGAAGARDGAPLPGHRGSARGRWRAARNCRTRSTSRPRSTPARKARACWSAPTRRRACRGRRGPRPPTSAMSCWPPISTGSRPASSSPFAHFPALERAGIKRVINGPFTFAPDGNPLVGPVPGLRNFYCACGVMAGFSQGGGVGLDARQLDRRGRPRHGRVRDGHRPLRRFRDPRLHQRQGARELQPAVFDHLPQRGAAGRKAAEDDPGLRPAQGAGCGVRRELRPRARALVRARRQRRRRRCRPSGARTRTGRSAQECRAVREGVGLLEIANYGKYEITGRARRPGSTGCSRAGCREPGRIALAPMLARERQADGRLHGRAGSRRSAS